MTEWSRYEISDLISGEILFIGDGYRAKNDELTKNGFPFARGGNINDGFHFEDADCFPFDRVSRVGNKISRPGDVVFTSKGTVGRFAFVRDDTLQFVYSPQLCFWRVLNKNIIDSRFLYFWMHGREFYGQFKSVSGQTDMAEYVSLTDQRRMHITLPAIATQKRIASILTGLDDKIELNRRMNETLEAMARAIFKDWFVDFGPTRAKAEGRAPYLADDIWSLFPDRLDEEEKPEGWQLGTLEAVSDLNPESWGASNKPKNLEYVDLANTKWGTIESTEAYLWVEAPSRARRVLRKGDTIVGTVRPGNGSYALVGRENLTGSTGFAVLRPKKGFYRELVYCAATSPDNISRLSHLADGGAYPAVRPDLVASTELVISSSSAIQSFSSICGPLIDRVEANKQESRTLAQTRDLLLPKLISGEIRVRDAETLVENAL